MSTNPRLQFDVLPQGVQFRVARVAANMTLFDVAVRANVSPPRLSEYERGRGGGLNIEQIDRVRGVLNAELARLYSGDHS